MSELRMCTTCEIPHAENCPECFGFGVYKTLDGGTSPVSASVAHGDDPPRSTVFVCGVCGGGSGNMGKAKA